MRQQIATLKYFKPSIVLLVLAILALIFTNAHIIAPIILVIGAIIMAWQNYSVLKVLKKRREQQCNESSEESSIADDGE